MSIKNALKWGSKAARGYVRINPALDWETPEPVTPKRRTYNLAEVERMEKEVRPWLRPIITTLAYTGLRVGELINLRWADVDLKEEMIHIRIRTDWRPKSGYDRRVPIHPKVAKVICAQPVGEFLFGGVRGGNLTESRILNCLKQDQKALGIEKGDVHAFRRFFATTMLRAGIDINTVREWGGWKTLETMQRYLADLTPVESREAMKMAAARLAV